MEQRSDVQFRAEKEYKNRKEKFFLLLREIISNSIHAVLIRKDKEISKGIVYIPTLILDIFVNNDEKYCSITLEDNGEGFTEINRKYFEQLDRRNEEKEHYNFHPLGQGRLALVYFADSAKYETVFKDNNGELSKKSFPYPFEYEGLFSFDLFSDSDKPKGDTYTKLIISVDKQNTFGRANTFFKNYPDVQALKKWIIETFFPVLVTNDDLLIKITYNREPASVSKKSIEKEVDSIPFKLTIDGVEYEFKLWLVQNDSALKGENPIECFARSLKAELENGKLSYTLDNDKGFLFYLTSPYFDDNVDNKGERIEILADAIAEINKKINTLLDDKFKQVIEENQKKTQKNYKNFKKLYPSLEVFIQEDNLMGKKSVVNEEDLVKDAVESKGKIERKFWTRIESLPSSEDEIPYDETEECRKLLNSSLQIYVRHRESVLDRLEDMIHQFNEDGSNKPELETKIQNLLLKRGTTLKESDNINHLHNLWILDDKFTTFSSTLQTKSTKPGQAMSDIYIWADDRKECKQILILELKSTTQAHNAGSSNESMVAQVKRYARDFYNNPKKILNWDVNPNEVQYMGIILSSKSDIIDELSSANVDGTYEPIPFLKDSFFKDDKFSKTKNDIRDKFPIRIELYSYEDIHKLASDRNNVFFRLLKKEYEIDENLSE